MSHYFSTLIGGPPYCATREAALLSSLGPCILTTEFTFVSPTQGTGGRCINPANLNASSCTLLA